MTVKNRKKGGISLNLLGESVLNWIKEQDKIHTHNLLNMEGIQELISDINNKSELVHEHDISEIRELQSLLSTLTENIEGKSNREHEHEISEIRELQTILDNKSELDHTHDVEDLRDVITTVIQEIPTNAKGLLYLDYNNITRSENAQIVESEDPDVVDKVIKTESEMEYDIRFQIPKEKLCLGSSIIKLRGKTNLNSDEPITLKVYAVDNFDVSTERQTWDILNSNVYVRDFYNTFTDKYNTINMRLFSKNAVGIEIYIENKHNNTNYSLELDHILIMPALPGVFMS